MPRAIKHTEDFGLSRVEALGNPESVAMEHINIGFFNSTKKVGPPRASSLQYTCIRKHVLGVRHEVEYMERLPIGDRITFDIGDAIHYRVQNTPNYFGDNRYGWWKCSACGNIRGFGRPPAWNCKSCGARPEATIYEEHSMVAPESYVCSGHTDLFIKVNGKLRVVEAKTIAADAFNKLVAPLVAHVWQVQSYMWFAKWDAFLKDRIFPNTGYVLYVSKGALYRGRIPMKMFVVKRSTQILDKIKEKLAVYTSCMNNGHLPPLDIRCERSEFTDYLSTDCPCLDLCKRNA